MTDALEHGDGAVQALGLDWIEPHPMLQVPDAARSLASLNRLTTGTLLPNWVHGRQSILPDESETEALSKHR